MATTIEQQIEAHKQAIADAEKRMLETIAVDTKRITVLEKIPEQFKNGKYSPHSAYTDGVIAMAPVETVSDAICQAKIANPTSMILLRDGFATFRPLLKCPEGKGTIETVCPYAVHVGGILEEVELFFFVEADGALFEVRYPIKSREIYRTARRVDFRGGYRYEDCQSHDTTGRFPRQIKWASGGSEYINDFTRYA